MIVRLSHTLAYAFEGEVRELSLSLRLGPRSEGRQECLHQRLHVTPRPLGEVALRDDHGNAVVRVALPSLRALRVQALSSVRVVPAGGVVAGAADGAMRAASPASPLGGEFAALARPCFAGGLPFDAALEALGAVIRGRLRYDEAAARVDRCAAAALRAGRGVCQDFAHVAVSCLRSLGVPARYVGGYLLPAAGPYGSHRAGVARAHAWASAWAPAHGWRDFDPLLGEAALPRHLAVAVGRDYGDAPPVDGLCDGAGAYRLSTRVTAAPEPHPHQVPASTA